jgi:hypothetical protein
MAKQVSEKDKLFFLSLTPDDITLDFIKDNFTASKNNPKAKFNFNDRLELKANEFYNKSQINTTVGRFICNKFLLTGPIIESLGYQDVKLDDKGIKSLDGKITELVLSNKIPLDAMYHYFDQCNWLAYAPTTYIVASLSTEMYIMDPEVKKLKEKLIEENKEAILKNDVSVISNIEDQLLDLSKEKVKDIPGFQIYDSGCRGSYGNNYKNSVLMRGAIMDFTDPSKFNASMASLTEGIPKEDFYKFANILTAGTYQRSKNTEKGGYMSKKVKTGFQHVVLDEKDSDCGSTKTIEVVVKDNDIANLYMGRYAVNSKGNLVKMTNDNKNNFIGKKIKFRSPMYCKGDKLCNICAGDSLYDAGFSNIGVIFDQLSETITNKAMKNFHDSSIKISELDYNSAIVKI